MAVLYTFVAPVSAPLDPGSSRDHKPRILMADFGDGYSQRAADGINNDPETRELSWTNLTKAEKDVIDSFFKARGGWQSFFYDHKGGLNPLVYVCTTWKVVDVDYDVYTVSATFQQVYDLG